MAPSLGTTVLDGLRGDTECPLVDDSVTTDRSLHLAATSISSPLLAGISVYVIILADEWECGRVESAGAQIASIWQKVPEKSCYIHSFSASEDIRYFEVFHHMLTSITDQIKQFKKKKFSSLQFVSYILCSLYQSLCLIQRWSLYHSIARPLCT